jgi:hypothetical protein
MLSTNAVTEVGVVIIVAAKVGIVTSSVIAASNPMI